MKYKYLMLISLLLTTQSAFAGNYILKINGQSYDLSLGSEEQIKVGEQLLTVQVDQKATLTYQTNNFSFQYPSKYSPSRSDLGNGIYQTALVTPLGAVVMVQEYTTMDPSALLDLMINELTKEEREYGYTIESNPSPLTLSSGIKLNGKVVTSRYKGSDIKRYLYTYGARDSGILIMTQIDYEVGLADEAVLNQFIDTLQITMN